MCFVAPSLSTGRAFFTRLLAAGQGSSVQRRDSELGLVAAQGEQKWPVTHSEQNPNATNINPLSRLSPRTHSNAARRVPQGIRPLAGLTSQHCRSKSAATCHRRPHETLGIAWSTYFNRFIKLRTATRAVTLRAALNKSSQALQGCSAGTPTQCTRDTTKQRCAACSS